MNPAMLMLVSTTISSAGSIIGGFSERAASELDAYNVETDMIRGKAEAIQRHNDRLETYRFNLSSNIAQFSSQGRDIGGADRSVSAFLERQKEVAASDTSRSDFMGAAEAAKSMAQAAAIRSEGRAKQFSAVVGAFTSMAGGLSDYQRVAK